MNNTIENLKKLGVASLLATVPLTGLSSCDDDKTVVVDRTVFEPSSELLNLEGKVVEFEFRVVNDTDTRMAVGDSGVGTTRLRYAFQAGNEVLITDTRNLVVQSGVYPYTLRGRDINIGILERFPNQNATEAVRLLNEEIERQPNGAILTAVTAVNIASQIGTISEIIDGSGAEVIQNFLNPQGVSISFVYGVVTELSLLVGSNSIALSVESEQLIFENNQLRKATGNEITKVDFETLTYSVTENTLN